MTDRLAEIRADILDRIEGAEEALARIEQSQKLAAAALAERRAELMAHDRAVDAMVSTMAGAHAEPATKAAKRKRNDVRGAVMLALGSLLDAGAWTPESVIASMVEREHRIASTAVHAYLLRAVKAKEVERDGDRSYRLPQPDPGEFALRSPTQDAAQ